MALLGLRGPLGLGGARPHAVEERHHVAVVRVERDHPVVVADLRDRPQLGARAVPRVLVVQHHRPPLERLELGYGALGVEDLAEPEDGVVRVVLGHHPGERAGALEELGHGRLHRGQLGGVVALVPVEVEEQVEDRLLGGGVPGGRQALPRALDGGHLRLAVLPRREHREEDVGAPPGQVPPPGGPLVEHRHRVAVDPEEVLSEIAQEAEPVGVGVGLHLLADVGAGGRLRLEVPADHGRELVERVHDGEIELSEHVRRENQPAMLVDHERFHTHPPLE